jgi:hypothetical protein
MSLFTKVARGSPLAKQFNAKVQVEEQLEEVRCSTFKLKEPRTGQDKRSFKFWNLELKTFERFHRIKKAKQAKKACPLYPRRALRVCASRRIGMDDEIRLD